MTSVKKNNPWLCLDLMLFLDIFSSEAHHFSFLPGWEDIWSPASPFFLLWNAPLSVFLEENLFAVVAWSAVKAKTHTLALFVITEVV